MAHVFISYARDNEQVIQRLSDELTRCGVEVWLSVDDRSHGHRQKARTCPYCGAVKIDKNPSHTYYCRRRRGIG